MHPPFLHFVREQRTPLPIIPTVQDCKGKTYVVTGANTGLGFECAQHFVHLGAKRVILACRSLSRGEAAKQRIEEATTIAGVVEVWHLDLGLYDSVSSFADRVQQLDRVDAIVENASLGFAQYTEAEGLETGLTVNVVGTFLLAVMVLPKLQECAKTFGSTPHLVVVGSEVEFGMEGQLEKLEGDLIYALNQYLKTSMSIRFDPSTQRVPSTDSLADSEWQLPDFEASSALRRPRAGAASTFLGERCRYQPCQSWCVQDRARTQSRFRNENVSRGVPVPFRSDCRGGQSHASASGRCGT